MATDQLVMPCLMAPTVRIEDITIRWEADEFGYSLAADMYGKYISSYDEGNSDCIIDRKENYMLGYCVDHIDAAHRWLEKYGKKLGNMKRVMRQYRREVDTRPIHRLDDLDFEAIYECFASEIHGFLGFSIEPETKRRIFASRTADCRWNRDSAQYFDPSPNYNLGSGADWGDLEPDGGPNKPEIEAFNEVSRWPSSKARYGSKTKHFNGWERYGIKPIIDRQHRPGFWVNVFYACEDHARLEAFNEGDWDMRSVHAEATLTVETPSGTEDPPKQVSEIIEVGWVGGYESDADLDSFKAVEAEMLEELRHEAESRGAKWPDIVDPMIEGDIPYLI